MHDGKSLFSETAELKVFFLQGGKVFSDTSLESFDYLLSYHANPMSLLFKYNDDGDDDGGAEDNDDDNEDHGVAVGVGRHRLVTADWGRRCLLCSLTHFLDEEKEDEEEENGDDGERSTNKSEL